MSEIRQRGYSRYWCRRCKRQLQHDTRRQDTISVRVAAEPPKWTHDRCGGMVMLSTPKKA